MNKIFLVTLALSSFMAYAEDVDYSRCLPWFGGLAVENDGKLLRNTFMPIKSETSNGDTQTIVMESNIQGRKEEITVSLVRDDEGRVLKATTGGDVPSDEKIKQYREYVVNSALGISLYNSGVMHLPGGFMSHEPNYFVRKKSDKESKPGQTDPSNTQRDLIYELVPLSRLTLEQAKEVGISGIEELRKLRQQWRRDSKAAKLLRRGLENIVERSALAIPMGQESEFAIQDGVCLPEKISNRVYNSLSGLVNSYPVSSRENCDKIRTVYSKHKEKIDNCNRISVRVSKDLMQELYPGYTGMYGGGSSGGYGPYGSQGGYGSFGGLGGYGSFGGMGADQNPITVQNLICEQIYQAQEQKKPTSDSSSPANGSGSQTNQL